MKNSMSPEPNLWFFRSLSLKKAYIDPNLSLTASRSRSSPPGCVCIPLSIAWSLVILQPLTRKTTLRRSWLAVVRRWNRSECEWLRLSPKFNVKQHRWRGNSYVFHVGAVLFVAFVSWGVLQVEECVELICPSDCRGFTSLVRELRLFP